MLLTPTRLALAALPVAALLWLAAPRSASTPAVAPGVTRTPLASATADACVRSDGRDTVLELIVHRGAGRPALRAALRVPGPGVPVERVVARTLDSYAIEAPRTEADRAAIRDVARHGAGVATFERPDGSDRLIVQLRLDESGDVTAYISLVAPTRTVRSFARRRWRGTVVEAEGAGGAQERVHYGVTP